MTYTVQQLATLSGVSVRTLHHYDSVGLLRPSRQEQNAYRQYEETDLQRLQQILFFRELDFPLETIKQLLDTPEFDRKTALEDQKALLALQQRRLATLIRTIEKTISTLKKESTMNDNELYEGFSKKQIDEYTEEARQRWGQTDVFRQSLERTKALTKKDWQRIGHESDVLLKALVAAMPSGPASAVAQELIQRHYDSLRTFYEPNTAIYRGLATMYVDDPRFAANYTKYHADLPAFMQQAMLAYCDTLDAQTKNTQ